MASGVGKQKKQQCRIFLVPKQSEDDKPGKRPIPIEGNAVVTEETGTGKSSLEILEGYIKPNVHNWWEYRTYRHREAYVGLSKTCVGKG